MNDLLFPFFTVSAILLLGFFGKLLFRLLNIPEIVFLVIFGIFLGPILHIIDISSIKTAIPYIASFSLAMLMFDIGLRLDIDQLVEKGWKIILIPILNLALSLLLIAVIAKYTLQLRWAYSVLLGAILGGSGLTVLLTILRRMAVKEELIISLSTEFALTNLLSIIIAISCLDYVELSFHSIIESLEMFFTKFSAGIVTGFIIGVFWIIIMFMVRREEFFYMFTLAMLLIAYSSAETLDGSGALASLILGLMIGNNEKISRILGLKINVEEIRPIRDLLRHFHTEITFLIRAFIFVVLGLAYIPGTLIEIIFGFGLTILLLTARLITVNLIFIFNEVREYKGLMSCVVGRGLVTAVLGVIAAESVSMYFELFLDLSIYVLLFSNIIMALLLFMVRKLETSEVKIT
ncbi:MAG: cation:proton antiporter [archaeon GB-1867-035]|nr:cation:proton antiporter [Candidatus Culexmicrobium profundum]